MDTPTEWKYPPFVWITSVESLPNPELQAASNSTEIGNTETITCFSRNGSLPINYTLFHNERSKGTVTVSKKTGATFNITIYNETSLGSYKCKANYGVPNSTYSKEFTFTLQKSLTNPELQAASNSTAIGNTEIITCFSRNGSLPINYTLFHNKKSKGTVTVSKKTGATFNITIYNETSLGPYKCKADYGVPNSTYSKEFTFTLQRQLYHNHQHHHHYLVWLIPMLILILVLLLAVILFKLIIKRRKDTMECNKGQEVLYSTVDLGESSRDTLECDKGQEVLYSTVDLGESSRDTTGCDKGQEVLYSTVELGEGSRDRTQDDKGQVLYSTLVHREQTRGNQVHDIHS
ncbi:allergin-1 [Pseudophryne corroboree]|uniref:allergin-1 n=1 Tax=Pseudophryne corroboree TaxID=495146 RepID=UPI003081C067